MISLENRIGYTFKNKALLNRALSHSSYANENKSAGGSNERLEFLGDAVLSIIVSDAIFRDYTNLPEGELTRIRASLVCEKSLFGFAKQIDLGSYIMLGRGERQTGGNERPSILSDAFEALIAAVYLDGGMKAAADFVMGFVRPELEQHDGGVFKDFKTKLQEIIQQNPEEQLEYRLVSESGPDHDKRFTIEVCLNSNVIGRGTGHSKKQAEQLAAKEAIELMGELNAI
jgi:ribonuclease-3